MNWFSIVLGVGIFFIILLDLTEFSVEVLCGWIVRWLRRFRCEKKEERQELKLGDARSTPSKYFNKSQASKLGDAPVGMPPFFINNYRLVSVDPKVLLLHMSCAILEMSFYFCFTCCFNKILYLDLEVLNKTESSHSYLFT